MDREGWKMKGGKKKRVPMSKGMGEASEVIVPMDVCTIVFSLM